MKNPQKTEVALWRTGTRLPLLALIPLALLISAVAAPDSAPPKDHTLFVGASLQVEDGPAFSELVGAKGSSVSLLADGKVHTMRSDALKNVRIATSLKLSDIIARIDKLEVTPSYVATNAERSAAMRQQVILNDMAIDKVSATNRQVTALNVAVGQQAVALKSGGSQEITAAAVLAASNNLAGAATSSYAMQASADSFNSTAAGTGDNALEISCALSTPKPTRNAYALVVTEFREASSTKSSYKVHIEPIGELGPKPRVVTMTQEGLPAGFALGRVGIHLYSDSKELATNLSEQRVDLTADDAMRYLTVCYVASHARETLAASPLRIALPTDFREKAVAADLDRTLFVTVGSQGEVQGLSAAPDHTVAVDPYVDSTVKKFRYNPALKEGKAVESVVELRLAGLLR